MDILNRDKNMFNSSFEMFFLYNINFRLNVLIYGSWRIRDLEAKFFKNGSDPLEHFGGWVKSAGF